MFSSLWVMVANSGLTKSLAQGWNDVHEGREVDEGSEMATRSSERESEWAKGREMGGFVPMQHHRPAIEP